MGKCPDGYYWDDIKNVCVQKAQDVKDTVVVKSGERGSFLVNLIAIFVGFLFVYFSLWGNWWLLIGFLVLAAVLLAYSKVALYCLLFGAAIAILIIAVQYFQGIHIPFFSAILNSPKLLG